MKKFALLILSFLLLGASVFAKGDYEPDKSVRFNMHLMLGGEFLSIGAGGPTFDFMVGARCTDYFFVGFETGVNTGFGYGTLVYLPFDVNMKAYIPATEDIKPYFNVSLGYLVTVMGYGQGFHCNAGFGLDFKHWSFGLGYTNCALDVHGGYVRVGYRIGR